MGNNTGGYLWVLLPESRFHDLEKFVEEREKTISLRHNANESDAKAIITQTRIIENRVIISCLVLSQTKVIIVALIVKVFCRLQIRFDSISIYFKSEVLNLF